MHSDSFARPWIAKILNTRQFLHKFLPKSQLLQVRLSCFDFVQYKSVYYTNFSQKVEHTFPSHTAPRNAVNLFALIKFVNPWHIVYSTTNEGFTFPLTLSDEFEKFARILICLLSFQHTWFDSSRSTWSNVSVVEDFSNYSANSFCLFWQFRLHKSHFAGVCRTAGLKYSNYPCKSCEISVPNAIGLLVRTQCHQY